MYLRLFLNRIRKFNSNCSKRLRFLSKSIHSTSNDNLIQKQITDSNGDDTLFLACSLLMKDLKSNENKENFQELETHNLELNELSERNFINRPIDNIIPLLNSLIENRQLKQVEDIILVLKQKRLSDWTSNLTTSFLNKLFNCALKEFELKRLTQSDISLRFKEFRKNLSLNSFNNLKINSNCCKPDIISFSFMLKYLLISYAGKENKSEIFEDFSVLFNEINHFKYDIEEIFENGILNDQEIKFIKSITHSNKSDLADIEKLHVKLNPDTVEKIPNIESKLPDVRIVNSKSGGISFVKDSLKELSILTENNSINQSELYQIQIKLERDCLGAMMNKMKLEREQLKTLMQTGNISSIKSELLNWFDVLHNSIKEVFDSILIKGGNKVYFENFMLSGRETLGLRDINDCQFYASVLSILKPEKIATIILQELLKIQSYESYSDINEFGSVVTVRGTKIVSLAASIGNSLQREIFADQIAKKPFLKKSKLSLPKLNQIFESKVTLDRTMRKIYSEMENDQEAIQDGWIPAWSPSLKVEIGTFLLLIACKVLKLNNFPVFEHKIVVFNSKKLGIIKLNDDVFEKLVSDKSFAVLEAWAMPMVVPPKPWLTIRSGGYLTHKSNQIMIFLNQ
jgi:DNA-directed RNA polymerase